MQVQTAVDILNESTWQGAADWAYHVPTDRVISLSVNSGWGAELRPRYVLDAARDIVARRAVEMTTGPLDEPSGVQVFATGARRSTDAAGVRYDLMSTIALRRLAETYAEGAAKYGADNWRKGIPSADLLNHAMRHVELYRSGDRSEDHLAHALWNLATLAHFDEAGNPAD